MKRHSRVLWALGALPLAAAAAPIANAAVVPTNDALAAARAIASQPSAVVGAEFVQRPPQPSAALSDTRLGQFPTSGKRFLVLSNGDPRLISAPNNSPGTSVDLGGPLQRGARDVTTLKVDLDVPQNARCLSVRFRFYSEEFPEWNDSIFNDAFIAELDNNTWDASSLVEPSVVAPDNFAFDTRGRALSVNSVGPTSVAPGRAADTTYDAATRRLRASTPITPGRHSLYLTIFDQGDRLFDSAVAIDKLTLDRLSPCTPGAAADVRPVLPPGTIELGSGRFSVPAISVFGESNRLIAQLAQAQPRRPRADRAFTFRTRVRDRRGFVIRGAQVDVQPIPSNLYRDPKPVRTKRNGTAQVRLVPKPGAASSNAQPLFLAVKVTKPRGTIRGAASDLRLVRVPLRSAR